jgi:hypothetical protein
MGNGRNYAAGVSLVLFLTYVGVCRFAGWCRENTEEIVINKAMVESADPSSNRVRSLSGYEGTFVFKPDNIGEYPDSGDHVRNVHAKKGPFSEKWKVKSYQL